MTPDDPKRRPRFRKLIMKPTRKTPFYPAGGWPPAF